MTKICNKSVSCMTSADADLYQYLLCQSIFKAIGTVKDGAVPMCSLLFFQVAWVQNLPCSLCLEEAILCLSPGSGKNWPREVMRYAK